MLTQAEHDANIMRIIEAVVASFGGTVRFIMRGEGYQAHIEFPEGVSQEQELACAEKVEAVIRGFGGELVDVLDGKVVE